MRRNNAELLSATSVPRMQASLMLIVGFIVLLAAAGCGGGSTSANGGGGGPTPASVSGTIAVGTAPSAVVVDSTNNIIYVTDFGTIPTGIPCSHSGADVEAIDGATQSTTSVGFYPPVQVTATGAALNPVSHQLYVQVELYWNGVQVNDPCDPFLPSMQVFDTTSLQPPNGEAMGGNGAGIDVNPATDTIYVTFPGVAGKCDVDGVGCWIDTYPRTVSTHGFAIGRLERRGVKHLHAWEKGVAQLLPEHRSSTVPPEE